MQKDVLGLDVAMDYTPLVRVLQCVGNFGCDADGVADRKLALALDPPSQRFAFHVRHHVVEQTVGATRIEERQYVGMLEIRSELDLLEEALGAQNRRELRMQDFDRDLAVVANVLGQVDRRHSARAELAFDAIAAAELAGEALCDGSGTRHRWRMWDSAAGAARTDPLSHPSPLRVSKQGACAFSMTSDCITL